MVLNLQKQYFCSFVDSQLCFEWASLLHFFSQNFEIVIVSCLLSLLHKNTANI